MSYYSDDSEADDTAPLKKGSASASSSSSLLPNAQKQDVHNKYMEYASSTLSNSWFNVNDTNSFFRVLVMGIGFFNGSYDSFVMSLVLVILSSDIRDPPLESLGMVAIATMLGVMGGQIFFGLVADMVGRTRAFTYTQIFVIIGALLTANAHGSASGFVVWLIVSRVIMGVGIGGEYPLSAALTSDSANTAGDAASRGSRMASVFAMQGAGCLAAPLVMTFLFNVLPMYKLNLVWRLGIAFTAVPGILLLYFRFQLKEAPSFATTPASSPSNTYSSSLASPASNSAALVGLAQDPSKLAALRDNMKLLFGTAASWFLFDFVFYSNAMFSAAVLSSMTKLPPNASLEVLYEHLRSLARFSLIISLIGVLGYYVGIKMIDTYGRKSLQRLGFLLMAANFVVMFVLVTTFTNIASTSSGRLLFVICYGLTFFFANMGPHLVTYVMAGEAFPRNITPIAHGISAAAGKLGAVLGVLVVPSLLREHGLSTVIAASTILTLLGAAVTHWCTVETLGPLVGQSASSSLSSSSPSNASTASADASGKSYASSFV